MAVATAEWLQLIEREYLDGYVTGGGAAVKLLVGNDAAREQAARGVVALAGAHGLLHAPVDAASVRLHMIQDVFFALSRQVVWEDAAQRFVEAMVAREGLSWPHPGEAAGLETLARTNAIDATMLRRDLQRWLTRDLMRDVRLAQDFRVAMMQLCHRRFEPPGPEEGAETGADVATILEWLRGEARRVGPLRKLQISGRIVRHNARAMLRSLCRWLRLCGRAGLCVTLDLRQLARKVAGPADGVRYGPAAVMDAYEVLRQLIDDIERMEGLLLVVLADEAFLDGDPRRSIDAYVALKMRVWPDVHALGRDNPLAPLVQLAASPQGDGPGWAGA